MAMVDLSGKIALITGASQGIGAAVAVAYAEAGAHVVLIARSKRGLEKTDDAVRAVGGSATLMPLDLSDLDALDKLGAVLHEKFGRLDIFVGNAGLLGTLSPLTDISMREFNRVMMVNLTANFALLKTLHPLLLKSPAGRAIFVTTGSTVVRGMAYWGTYGVSKTALETLVRTYAAENAKNNLRVNLIDPGRVRTDMRATVKPGEDPMSLPAPEDIMGKFLELAADNCQHHGEVVAALAS